MPHERHEDVHCPPEGTRSCLWPGYLACIPVVSLLGRRPSAESGITSNCQVAHTSTVAPLCWLFSACCESQQHTPRSGKRPVLRTSCPAKRVSAATSRLSRRHTLLQSPLQSPPHSLFPHVLASVLSCGCPPHTPLPNPVNVNLCSQAT